MKLIFKSLAIFVSILAPSVPAFAMEFDTPDCELVFYGVKSGFGTSEGSRSYVSRLPEPFLSDAEIKQALSKIRFAEDEELPPQVVGRELSKLHDLAIKPIIMVNIVSIDANFVSIHIQNIWPEKAEEYNFNVMKLYQEEFLRRMRNLGEKEEAEEIRQELEEVFRPQLQEMELKLVGYFIQGSGGEFEAGGDFKIQLTDFSRDTLLDELSKPLYEQITQMGLELVVSSRSDEPFILRSLSGNRLLMTGPGMSVRSRYRIDGVD